MFKIMDDGLCADKDIATLEMAQYTCMEIAQQYSVAELPFSMQIKDQFTGELVETCHFSLKHEVTKHE